VSIAFNIHIEGKHEDDALCALEEVRRLIEGGFTSGLGSSVSGSYSFSPTEPVDQYE
jgi:hypothetical protein